MALGPVMLDVEGLTLTPADRDLLREPAVGGVILFTRNYESPALFRGFEQRGGDRHVHPDSLCQR